jgi:hypothetical protein
LSVQRRSKAVRVIRVRSRFRVIVRVKRRRLCGRSGRRRSTVTRTTAVSASIITVILVSRVRRTIGIRSIPAVQRTKRKEKNLTVTSDAQVFHAIKKRTCPASHNLIRIVNANRKIFDCSRTIDLIPRDSSLTAMNRFEESDLIFHGRWQKIRPNVTF